MGSYHCKSLSALPQEWAEVAMQKRRKNTIQNDTNATIYKMYSFTLHILVDCCCFPARYVLVFSKL